MTSIFATKEMTVPVTTATKGAGIARSPAHGSFFHAASTAMVTRPSTAAAGLSSATRSGKAMRFATGELAGEPPRRT